MFDPAPALAAAFDTTIVGFRVKRSRHNTTAYLAWSARCITVPPRITPIFDSRRCLWRCSVPACPSPPARHCPALTLTEFTLDTGVAGVTSGTFETVFGIMVNLGTLVGSGNTFNYAAQVFTPSASDIYTFGMSSALVDTSLVLYQNSHDPTNPTVNAVAVGFASSLSDLAGNFPGPPRSDR